MSDEIVFDVLCTKVLDALRALGLGKFSIRNYYYEGMWPIIKVYRSEGVILYSAAFTNEIVDRFRLEHENGLVADRIWAKVRKAAALFEEYSCVASVNMKRIHEPLDLRVYGTRRISAANSLHISTTTIAILAKI